MALHDRCLGASDEWYTPPHVFTALGYSFDLDVASPGKDITPWIPAVDVITAASLSVPWHGFVWMNPPFGGRNALAPWLEKFLCHGDGIALVPDRTSAPWWQRCVPRADLVLFVAKKIRFIPGPGNDQENKSPADGTTLLAMGKRGREALYRAEHHGLGTVWQRPESCRIT